MTAPTALIVNNLQLQWRVQRVPHVRQQETQAMKTINNAVHNRTASK
jgi:hypothetical protein